MHSPVHASVEDITSLQSVRKIFTAIIWHKEGNTGSYFYIFSFSFSTKSSHTNVIKQNE